MNPMIVTDLNEQRERLIRIVSDAAMKATGTTFDSLRESGVLNLDNLQEMLKKEDDIATAIAAVVKLKIASYADNILGNVRLISGADTLSVEPTDGTETFAKEPDIFTCDLPAVFSGRVKREQVRATKMTPIAIYEMAKDCDVVELFMSFGIGLDKLCLTQGQAISFIKKYFVWLHPGHYATFILVKVGDLYHVVYVFRSGRKPRASIYPFDNRRGMLAFHRRRVVVPIF